ncbi:hypothetical protein ACFONC_08275 [Luteimonas soli]|uniref:DUF5668 domain-containing protein n=1 Tax=Luteimonas soli TaxID=1648966 RepID=A0ABV7XMW9_9GAMM
MEREGKWRLPARIVVVTVPLVMAGLLLLLAHRDDPGRPLSTDLWWPAWPMIVLAIILGTVRMASAVFVAACLLALFLLLSMATLDYTGSTPGTDLGTAWGLTNLVAWLGLMLLGGVALVEAFVRFILRERRRPDRLSPDPGSERKP